MDGVKSALTPALWPCTFAVTPPKTTTQRHMNDFSNAAYVYVYMLRVYS